MSDNKKHKTQTGGLQEKKVKVEPTKEEIKAEEKERKEKRKEKKKENRKERRGPITRIKEVAGELKRVEWPTFARTCKQTGVVLGVVVAFAIVVFAIDFGLGELYRLLTRRLTE